MSPVIRNCSKIKFEYTKKAWKIAEPKFKKKKLSTIKSNILGRNFFDKSFVLKSVFLSLKYFIQKHSFQKLLKTETYGLEFEVNEELHHLFEKPQTVS